MKMLYKTYSSKSAVHMFDIKFLDMNFNTFLIATICTIFMVGCRKAGNAKYQAEGYVYLINSTQTVSNVPVVMTVCHHTGTRCVYDFVTKTYTDADGYYFISGKRENGGSLSIEVGSNDKTFGSPPINEILYPNKILRKDFYVEAARYVTARFIVQPQNRNFAELSINSGIYSGTKELFRNATTEIDTTLKYKYVANNRVNLKVLLQNENTTTHVYTDSLIYFKDLGVPLSDTNIIWIVS